MVIRPVPMLTVEGTRKASVCAEHLLDNIVNDIELFLTSSDPSDRINLTCTTQSGNEIHVSELILETKHNADEVAGIGAVVKTLADDGNLKAEVLNLSYVPTATIHATLRGVEIEASNVSYATKLFDQLSSGFHFNEKLYDQEFDK